VLGQSGAGSPMTEPVLAGLMPPLAQAFDTRPELTRVIGSALQPGSAVILAAPTAGADPIGWAGVACPTGKTQLAAFLTLSLCQSGAVDFAAWIDAADRASLLSGLAWAAAAVGVTPAPSSQNALADFTTAVSASGRTWLLVLDGAPDVAELRLGSPVPPAGRILVTTPATAADATYSHATTIPVGLFSPREALTYLTGRLSDTDARQGAPDLADELGGEPLAIAQAGAVIVSSGQTCRAYRDVFVSRRQRYPAGAPASAAAVTWTLCYDEAERLSPDLDLPALLVFVAMLSGNGVPADVFTTAAARAYFGASGPTGADRILRALSIAEWVGLLSIGRSGPEPRIWISRDVQVAIREATSTATRVHAARAGADALVEAWPETESAPWTAEVLRACAATLLRQAPDAVVHGGHHRLVELAGQSLDSAGLAGSGAAFWAEVASASDRLLPQDHPDTLMASGRAAAACLAAGRWSAAVAWYQRVLTDQNRIAGPEHQDTIAARISLGRALLAAGEQEDGISVLGAAVRDCERMLGPARPSTLDARDELAAGCRTAGRLGTAAELYRRSLAERELVQGQRHPATITTRANLAATELADGKVEESITLFRQVLADREQVLGSDHPDTITARAGLAAAYQQAGRAPR
jgi:tetratricopeptide (TPR) repeat protein